MDTAASPSASATAMAASAIWSRLSAAFGPRVRGGGPSHRNSTLIGLPLALRGQLSLPYTEVTDSDRHSLGADHGCADLRGEHRGPGTGLLAGTMGLPPDHRGDH